MSAPIWPSTTTSGDVLAPRVERPRRRSVKPPLGLPPGREIDKPATLPCNNWATSLMFPLLNCSEVTVATALVTSFLFCVPYPTTTTSFNCPAEGERETFSVVWSFTSISWMGYPTNEKTNTELLLGTVIENDPKWSDVVPTDLPLIVIETPGNACPLLSVTFPWTFTWAKRELHVSIIKVSTNPYFNLLNK